MINPETILNMDIRPEELKFPESFAWFMKYRCRGWVICDKPIGTRVADLRLPYAYNTYSSGEGIKSSCMVTRGVGHILTWMNMMHYSPMAIEKFAVAPGEPDPNMEAELASLINNGIIQIPGGKVEVHSLETKDQIEGCVSGVTFTDDMYTFFKENLYPVDKGDNKSDNGSECSVANSINGDAFDALRDSLPDVLPTKTSDAPGTRPKFPPTDTCNTPNLLPYVLPADAAGTTGILPAEPNAPATIGVLSGSSPNISLDTSPSASPNAPRIPGALPPASRAHDILPGVYADALFVAGSPIYFDDVDFGRTGPYDLSGLQYIREEEEDE